MGTATASRGDSWGLQPTVARSLVQRCVPAQLGTPSAVPCGPCYHDVMLPALVALVPPCDSEAQPCAAGSGCAVAEQEPKRKADLSGDCLAMQPEVPHVGYLLSQGLLNEVSSLRYLNAKPARALTLGCNVGCAFSESPKLLVLLLVFGCLPYRPWPGLT